MKLLGKINLPTTTTKAWIILGVTVAGVIVLAETRRRRRRRRNSSSRGGKATTQEEFIEEVFIERFELLPSPSPKPPLAPHPLKGLTFAVKDIFDVKGYVTGFGNPDWKSTHEPATKSAAVVSLLLKNGAICVGKTVMDELAFGITGENMHYGTPTNPAAPTQIPGGSSSGSAVAVAAQLVDFALGTDTIGCVRIPASFCGIFGFRPSHGAVSAYGVLPNSQSLDTVGWFARDPFVLHSVGKILLQGPPLKFRRERRLIFADDCFQFSKVPERKSMSVVNKAIENLSGYHQAKHVNIGQHVASSVPSLKGFCEKSKSLLQGITTLKALSYVMILLQRYEFKTNHEDWIKTVKPILAPDVSAHVLAALGTTHENIKTLYNVRTELRAALHSLLKEDGILVVPTIPDFAFKHNSKETVSSEFQERAFVLLSLAGMSGCCQGTVPLGEHDDCPINLSFIASHGADKFLLDTLLDIHSPLREQVTIASNALPLPDTDGNMDTSELLKEKGNAAFKGKQWNKAINYYSEAIKLNKTNATYFCNRAAAYLELGCFQQAEADCSQAILLDKKNVKAYLRRGTAREMLFFYKEAANDFKHALVLEPHNKVANLAEKRLNKLASGK